MRRDGSPTPQKRRDDRPRLRTIPWTRLPSTALEGASTLESRTLPKVILGGFVGLVVIQLWLAL